MDVLMFTAGLRVMAAMGRADLLDNLMANLSMKSEAVQDAVVKEIQARGLMTSDELTDSLMMALEIRRRATQETHE